MKRAITMTLLAAILLFPVAAWTTGGQAPEDEQFFHANQAYKEGRYLEALEGYTTLLQAGFKNGHLYYNMGNAHFRLNRLGPAILNYERARLYIPRDADLNFNLNYARDRVQDRVPESRGPVGSALFWLDALNLVELFWAFVVMNGLFWGILIVRLISKTEWTYYLTVILLILWAIAGASFGLKWYQAGTDARAVVLENEINVRAGPDAGNTALFKLHAGTIVQLERLEDGWGLIRVSENKRGWVENGGVEAVRR
ncbi:MAG: SH3 domain-containing protein [Deltaproteobacteria bacterium]|nr:SH3 domain-containing protein [Deltaproteobacteria bacterium]MBW1816282.1 SH3 domain-containing protein [Deltaproteobacteria bacterium]MBW2282984.1 SH3 domain-containing protein [Deltaproteobacteria bacterium]